MACCHPPATVELVVAMICAPSHAPRVNPPASGLVEVAVTVVEPTTGPRASIIASPEVATRPFRSPASGSTQMGREPQ